MTQYVALVRNIGPATHSKMPLGKLAEACATASLDEVVSIGNTGNLVFATDKSQAEAQAIVTAGVKSFGLDNEVFTRTRRQIQMLVSAMPFADAAADHPGQLTVCFFHRAPAWPASYLNYGGPERMLTFSKHLVVDYGAQVSASKLTIEKTIGARMTQRNWSTVLKIAARLGIESPEAG